MAAATLAAMPRPMPRVRARPAVPQRRGATASDTSGTTASKTRGRYSARRAPPLPVGAAGSYLPGDPEYDLVHVIARHLGAVGKLGGLEVGAPREFVAGDLVELRLIEMAERCALGHAPRCVHE